MMPDVIALQTILPVLSFTTLNSVEILNSETRDELCRVALGDAERILAKGSWPRF